MEGDEYEQMSTTNQIRDEALALHNSDHPGMVLVTTPLNGNNFLSWSRSIKIALGAKTKLAFIDGSITPPAPETTDFMSWKKADFMVMSWLLNSISKGILESFVFSNSSRELWFEIEARFGDSNGPLMYQIQREICNTTQGNLSITKYFSKLKKLWDEQACLEPISMCTCGAAQRMNELKESNRVLQFLIDLNDGFDNSKDQILLMEPLPSIHKTYVMMLKVKKQRSNQTLMAENMEMSALMSKIHNPSSSRADRGSKNIHNSVIIPYSGSTDVDMPHV